MLMFFDFILLEFILTTVAFNLLNDTDYFLFFFPVHSKITKRLPSYQPFLEPYPAENLLSEVNVFDVHL